MLVNDEAHVKDGAEERLQKPLQSAEYPPLSVASYTLLLLFLAYVLSFIDRQVLALLVGPIRHDFGISDFEYSLLQGLAFSILYTVASIPFGRLADRYSRKWLVSGAVVFWSAATLACGLAKNFGQLFVARMSVGAGEAGLTPGAYSLIMDSFRPKHASYAMSIYKIAVHVGMGLALVLGGFLYDYYDGIGGLEIPGLGTFRPWQATLLTVGVPGFVLGALLMTVREPRRQNAMTNSDGTISLSLPIRSVLKFTWSRRRVYFSLFIASSALSMAWYGSAAWYPEFLFRIHGMSKSEAGFAFGMIGMVGGSLGILFAAWLADRLRARKFIDANVRTILMTTVVAMPLSVAAPLMGDEKVTLILLALAVFVSSGYVGLMAIAFVSVTPNQMRGQMTAIYIFVTNILGMAVGTSLLAAFTDFVFKGDEMLPYSLASINAIFYPVAVAFLWYCLPAYKGAVNEAESGKWSDE